MSQMNQVKDDEIDLLELFQTLWDGKWLISTTVAIAVLLGYGFLLSRDVVYQSKLIYSVDTIPPFYDIEKASVDFEKRFYSGRVFEEWKKNNSDTTIVFEDFSATEFVDGFLLSKDEGEQAAILTSEARVSKKANFSKKVNFILVRSNNLPILNDYFEYALYISEVLKGEYIARASDELNIIETRFKDFSTAKDTIIAQLLSIDRFVSTAKKGANVLTVQRPSMPKKVSPKASIILAMSVVLGGMLGVMYVLISNAIRKRKEQLAKA